MKTKIFTILAILLTSFTLQANETKPWYDGIYIGGGLGYVPGGIGAENTEDKIIFDFMPNKTLLNGFVGYELHKYLDIEAGFNYAFETNTSDKSSPHLISDFSYYTLNIALKPKYAINKQHVVFGVLGLGYFNGYDDLRNYNEDDSYTSVVYKLGFGYEYKVNNNHSIVAEYNYNIFNEIDKHYSYNNSNSTWNDGKSIIDVNNYNQFNIAYKYSFK